MNNLHPVIVVWRDASCLSGWRKKDETEEFIRDHAKKELATSIGYLLCRNKETLALTMGTSLSEELFQHILVIPAGLIVSVTPLIVKSKRKYGKIIKSTQK